MSNASNKPERISAEGLAQAAARGVERAIEARRAAGIELLSSAQVNEVSGGFLPNPILIRGIPPVVNLPGTLPSLPAGF